MTTTTQAAVDRLLSAFAAGRGGDAIGALTDDVVLDATVPGWRFSRVGPEAVAATYAGWFADPGSYEELERRPVAGGEVLTYTLTWVEHGVPHAAHHCHVLTFAPDGRVARDLFFCGGRWDAGLLARMAEASDAH